MKHPESAPEGVTPGLTLESLAKAKKLPVAFLKTLGIGDFKYKGQPAVRIPYHDAEGNETAIRFRLNLTGSRRFVWRTNDHPQLYGLERLDAARKAGWVLLVEGESDCWTCWHNKLPGLGIPGKAIWKPEWAAYLHGINEVYLWQEPQAEDLTRRVYANSPNLKVIIADAKIKDPSEAHVQGENLAAYLAARKLTARLATDIEREAKQAGLAQLKQAARPITDTAPRPKEADRLVKLVEDLKVELFHDDIKTPFARVPVDGHSEIWACRSPQFKRWLAGRFWQAEGKAPNAEAIGAAMNVIEAKGCFEGKEYVLNNRIANYEGAVYYDLSDRDWRAVRVTGTGWEIVNQPPVLFRRYSHQAPQVEPLRAGNPRKVLEFVNIRDKTQQVLVMVYLASCFIPGIAHPIPNVHGEKGSAKSTLLKVIRLVVDPSCMLLLSLPKDKTEFVQILSHHYLPYFDNVSWLSDEYSDILCRAVTDEGFSKRELYSNDEDVIYKYRRCPGLNGINVAATKPDLLDRAILFRLETISKEKRREEQELLKEFANARREILGGCLDAVSKAMSIYPTTHLNALPRMADFARWGCALATALGYSQDDFLKAYEENIQGQNLEALDSNTVANVLLAFMANRDKWEGQATDLYQQLVGKAEEMRINTRARNWPKAPNALTRRLNELRSNLRGVGIVLDEGTCRSVIISKDIPLKDRENTVNIVNTVAPNTNQPQRADDVASDGKTSSSISSSISSVSGEGQNPICGDDVDDINGIFPNPAEDVPEQPSSIPMMITHQMEASLRTAGYTPEQVAMMKPKEAWEILKPGWEAPV